MIPVHWWRLIVVLSQSYPGLLRIDQFLSLNSIPLIRMARLEQQAVSGERMAAGLEVGIHMAFSVLEVLRMLETGNREWRLVWVGRECRAGNYARLLEATSWRGLNILIKAQATTSFGESSLLECRCSPKFSKKPIRS